MGLMQFALEPSALRKFEAGAVPVNLPMLRVFAKAGIIPDDWTSKPGFLYEVAACHFLFLKSALSGDQMTPWLHERAAHG